METIERSHETISAFAAKTHLSRLLQEVEEGHIITITKRGRPVARLGHYMAVMNKMFYIIQVPTVRWLFFQA